MRYDEFWYAASALGLPIVTPFLLACTNPQTRQKADGDRISTQGFILTSLLVAVSFILFKQDEAPLLFLIFPVLLLATWGGGLLGTVIGAVALTSVGTWFTIRGEGAVTTLVLPSTNVADRIHFRYGHARANETNRACS